MPADSLLAKIDNTVNETALPTLSPEHISSLEEDFTVDDFPQAIKDFLLGKSPGTDGFNNKFYKVLGDLLSLFMCKVFNSVSSASLFAPQSMEAYILVLPKPGKDLQLAPTSNRSR